MKFDWVDYLKLADALQSNPDKPGPREASFRAATSRAYYAAFHCAICYAINEGFQERCTGDDHWNIRKHYREHQPNNKIIRNKISVDLERMYDNRRMADYRDKITKSSPNNLASYTIKLAQRLLQNLKALNNS